MQAKEIKSGTILNYNERPCLIESVTVQSPTAHGAAPSTSTRAEPDQQAEGRHHASRRRVAGRGRLPQAGHQVHVRRPDPRPLLDQDNYNQYSLVKEDVTEESKYITGDLEGVLALIYNDECVGVQLPVAVEFKVVECDPAIKGASATARSKPATLETGLVVQVPEYLSRASDQGRYPRNGYYLSRAWIDTRTSGRHRRLKCRQEVLAMGKGREDDPVQFWQS